MDDKNILDGLKTAHFIKYETQNKAYQGQIVQVGPMAIRSRQAKKTPTKNGYFVVFWEKDDHQKNQPFTDKDACDYLLVKISDGDRQGQFLFPKEILIKEGILRSLNKPGKMAMRVYPNWEKNLNVTAKKTQKWQLPYFSEIPIE